MQVAILLVAICFWSIAILLGRVDGRFLTLAVVLTLAAASVVGLVSLADSDLGWMAWNFKNKLSPREPLEIHQTDPILGWTNKANAKAVDRHYDYEVTYDLNEHGHRAAGNIKREGNDSEQPSVVCLGGSFTFGQGVENDETYPYVTSQLLGDQFQVINAGVNGWGTVQATLYLDRIIAQGKRPAIVTYGFIPAHLVRNADRESWLKVLALSDREKPVINFYKDHPIFQRLVGVGDGAEDSPSLDEEEADITLKCIARMDQLCKQIDAKFYCLLLGNDSAPDSPSFATSEWLEKELAELGVSTISMIDIPPERFRHDGHPLPSWHQKVAERLSQVVLAALAETN